MCALGSYSRASITPLKVSIQSAMFDPSADTPDHTPSTLAPPMTLFDRFRHDAGADWHDYVGHAFVRDLGAGTLAPAAFRYYLEQDYLFLIHFARAYALAAFKADTLEDMRAAAETMRILLDVEMKMHVKYCAGWGLTEQAMAALSEDH